MKKIPIIQIAFVLGLMSCNRSVNDQSVEYIVNDELTSEWMDQITKLPSQSELINNWNQEIGLIENPHTDDLVDTTFLYTLGSDSIAIYKTSGKIIPLIFEVSNQRIRLNENVAVGMTKEDFQKELGINVKGNFVEIGEFVQNAYFTFKFNNEKLMQISYSGYFE